MKVAVADVTEALESYLKRRGVVDVQQRNALAQFFAMAVVEDDRGRKATSLHTILYEYPGVLVAALDALRSHKWANRHGISVLLGRATDEQRRLRSQ